MPAFPRSFGGVYPDQRTDIPSVMHAPQFDLQREYYGPQFHDRTPELVYETEKLRRLEKHQDVEYELPLTMEPPVKKDKSKKKRKSKK